MKLYKIRAVLELGNVAPYVGAWIETQDAPFIAEGFRQSHPTWVRGLKPVIMNTAKTETIVAPYVGAWIETL